jgi:PAS domain S-box-containing protein
VNKDPVDERDEAAQERDTAAEALDRAAEELTRQAAGLDASQKDADEGERRRHREDREHGADLRDLSADDRAASAQDRRESMDESIPPVVGADTRMRARNLAAHERDIDAAARDENADLGDLTSDVNDAAYEHDAERDRARHPQARQFAGTRRDASADDRQMAAVDRQSSGAQLRDAGQELQRLRELARQVLNTSIDAYIGMDCQGRVETWNEAAHVMFGWTQEEAVGRPIADLIVPESRRDWVTADLRRFVEIGESAIVDVLTEQICRRRDGSGLPVELVVSAVGSGEQTTFHAFLRDISERKQAHKEIELLAAVMRSSQDAIIAVDSHGYVQAINPAYEQLYGLTSAEVIGRKFSKISATFIPPESQTEVRGYAQSALAGQTVSYTQDRTRSDGSLIIADTSLAPIRNEDGTVIGIASRARDVTAQTQVQRDLVTSQRLVHSIISNTPSAVSVRDAGFRFLLANQAFADFYGVPLDEVIGHADTEVLPAGILATDRLADHRVLAGESITDEIGVSANGTERTVSRQRFPLTDEQGQPYAIATIGTDITDQKNVEVALRERIEWEGRIVQAVQNGHLLVYSQPIISLATGKKVSEELLVRLVGGKDHGDVIAPADFLPQAEKFGLTPLIDRFMITRAVELASSGRHISVNISAHSLGTVALVKEITTAIEASPAAAAYLTFEITETATLANPEIARRFSNQIVELGAGVALDDFGTGYGTLTDLRQLKLQALKIDMSFVAGLVTSPDDQRIVKLIIAIAKEYGLTTIAEGVESAETLNLLREYGADQAQGYFFARPAPI